LGAEAVERFGDFVRFSLSLSDLDGRKLAADPAWRNNVDPEFTKFLRTDEDLARAHGEAILGETRVNPNGTLDISSWHRPQNDGPALRALSVLRWLRSAAAFDQDLLADVSKLLRADLAYTMKHWRDPSFDIWEEEDGLHYYTLLVQSTALANGAEWLAEQGDRDLAAIYRREAEIILRKLDDFWLPDEGFYRSRILSSGVRSTKERDIAVVLATIHSRRPSGTHSASDSRTLATLAVLEDTFSAEYEINRGLPAGRGIAMGRYPGDTYYSGGAYYFSTLGAAELCFRAAAVGGPDARALFERGDAFLETARAYTPESGDLSEQFDRTIGAQTSAKQLAWSFAAFISCIAARRSAGF
jgi:glucoamylase